MTEVACMPWDYVDTHRLKEAIPRGTYHAQTVLDRLGRIASCEAREGRAGKHARECRQRLEEALAGERERAGTVKRLAERAAAAARAQRVARTQPAQETGAWASAASPEEATSAAALSPHGQELRVTGRRMVVDVAQGVRWSSEGGRDIEEVRADNSQMQVGSERVQVRGQSSGAQDDAESKEVRTVSGTGVNLVQSYYDSVMLMITMAPGVPSCYASRSDIWPDRPSTRKGRQCESELVNEFGVYEQVQEEENSGKSVGAQWLYDECYDDERKMYIRKRIEATRATRGARSDCFMD